MANEIVAAIIPAHNEEKTIEGVVRPLVNSPFIHEVIVVSDGSTDQTSSLARHAGAKVYDLEPCHGKGGAMLFGVQKTKANVLAFFDGDLLGLNEENVQSLITPVLSGKRSMNVGIRDRGLLATWMSHHLPLVSGERAMRRDIFESIPVKYLQGFMIENAVNYYCRSRKKTYGAVTLDGVSIRTKYEKVGFMRGMLQYVRMWLEVAQSMILVRLSRIKGEF